MTAIATSAPWAASHGGHHRHKRHAKGRKALVGAALMHAMASGHRGHRGGPGHGFGHGGFGPFGDFGRGFGGRGRGRRARRGDVRGAALLLLAEQPLNGYQLMQEIEERSGGVWRPSPGSIYPALSQLEDEGLVRSDESAGRRAFQLTDEGREYVEANREALGVPWEDVGGDLPEGLFELRRLMMQVGMAAMQVAQAGNEAQTAEATKVLDEARRALYRILAGDEPSESGRGEA